MLKIKNVASFAVLICGFYICFAASVSAQIVPSGSYQKTCTNIKVVDSVKLSADCKPKKEKSFDLPPIAELKDFYLCVGDISNNDAQLQCTKNENSPNMKAAKAAIDAGLKDAFGRNAFPAEYPNWIKEMFKGGLQDQFYKGLQPLQGVIFFNGYVSRPENAKMRQLVVENAFKDVYSYGASPKDIAYWNAELQKGGGVYSRIVRDESKKLNSDKVIRRLMIFTAYKKTMGRNPAPAEVDYWMPKTEHFKQLVDASRDYLYATNGSKDLAETVKRALIEKGNNNPSIEQINNAIINYSSKKAIFSEM